MDRRSWLWRRKSSEKSLGETESSGSALSQSERFFDDQEPRSPNNNSSINTSPNSAESPEISPIVCVNVDHEIVKSLNEKLSAALLSISAKEDLVDQHSKVAEEAVSGWEKAETEVAILKQQLEATTQKNSALKDRISHLDEALKECVRQLRQSRDEQDLKIHDAVHNKTQEWESNKSELENEIAELKRNLEASKTIEKENADLKTKLLSLSEELKVQTLERELTTQTAESASKQHLESIKKLAKLESECRRLQAIVRKKPSINTIPSSACIESLPDSQSDSGGRLAGVDSDQNCSDSWASALIAELDQFKSEKSGAKFLATCVDIDLMDDFLEMERIAALDEADKAVMRESSTMLVKMTELEEKVDKMESEIAKLEMNLVDTQNQLELSSSQLKIAQVKLVQLQKELELANEEKEAATVQGENVEAKRKALEIRLELTLLEVGNLQDKVATLEVKVDESREVEAQLRLAQMEVEKLNKNVGLLEGRVEQERALSAEFAAKIDTTEAMRKDIECQLQEKVKMLEKRVEDERSLSTKFAAKVEALEIDRKALEVGLESAHSEVQNLSHKVGFLLQDRVEQERALSAEFAAKLETVEATRKDRESQLQEKVKLLEKTVEDERSLSTKFAAKVEALEVELESAHSQVQKLSHRAGFLEEEIERERALKSEFTVKYQNLENELWEKRRKTVVPILNGELTVKQEQELSVAAEKMAECQKTIASLGKQLKSLTAFNDLMIESEKLQLNGSSSPPSSLPGFGKFLSHGRSRGVENQ